MANESCGCNTCKCGNKNILTETSSDAVVEQPTPLPTPQPVPFPSPVPAPSKPIADDDLVSPEKKHKKKGLITKEPWFKDFWKPAMAWAFCSIILFDFILAPIFNWLFFFYSHGTYVAWTPLTLGSGGFFYVCMMVVLGITSFNSPTKLADGTVVGGMGNKFIQPPQ